MLHRNSSRHLTPQRECVRAADLGRRTGDFFGTSPLRHEIGAHLVCGVLARCNLNGSVAAVSDGCGCRALGVGVDSPASLGRQEVLRGPCQRPLPAQLARAIEESMSALDRLTEEAARLTENGAKSSLRAAHMVIHEQRICRCYQAARHKGRPWAALQQHPWPLVKLLRPAALPRCSADSRRATQACSDVHANCLPCNSPPLMRMTCLISLRQLIDGTSPIDPWGSSWIKPRSFHLHSTESARRAV
jgi:hypothetical protein